jgi:hypothetical protein
VQAVSWYRKAAEQGHAKAQSNLGYSYANGKGVAKDEIEAYAYYNLAGITNEIARNNLAILGKGMSPDARLLGQQARNSCRKRSRAGWKPSTTCGRPSKRSHSVRGRRLPFACPLDPSETVGDDCRSAGILTC